MRIFFEKFALIPIKTQKLNNKTVSNRPLLRANTPKSINNNELEIAKYSQNQNYNNQYKMIFGLKIKAKI